ncbi:lipoprotein-releasing system permease protein [Plasticicumulans lactativorans]|uniref:Lipoprotein-releasing system permease protein n=1 Tax=Plasticicumulans lactativorans TaxID=1133106 RepID=A0A4R2LET4_9GAMM|nr:lipoprotein-releasing ABC transporter permease subunit [Plasticicumulans lactativorans]TCO83103.1 lipoprotein-releasing system permease protein [Plasticicumulans lactativorans]
MFQPLALFIGLRYTRAKRRNHFISFISASSMLGIALGITALITVLSVMNGFQKEVRERILSMTAHATISGVDGRLDDWRQAREVAQRHPEVLATAPFIRGEAMLTNGPTVSGALVQGILPDEEGGVSEVMGKLVVGDWNALAPGSFGIVLGKQLAAFVGVTLGDKVTVVAPQASVTPAGVVPRLKRFEVVGIFDSGLWEYDRNLALVHIDDAARLYQMEGSVSGLRLKLKDLFRAPLTAREIANALPGAYWVRDWTQEHANFFRAVAIEKTAMTVILMLIVAVAAFNLVSTLVMVVTDKQADIAILRTLGLSPAGVMAVFVVQGTTIGFIGTALGVAGGVALALNVKEAVGWLEGLLGFKFLSPEVYPITDLPSQVIPGDVVTVGVIAFTLAVLATLYPAWRAARTQPAEALRYE